MEYVLKFTGQKIGIYTLKVCGYVAAAGLTVLILKPVRKAVYARLHGNSRNVYRGKMSSRQQELFAKIHTIVSEKRPGYPFKILYYGTGVLETYPLLPKSQITCVTTDVHRPKDIARLKKEHPDVQVYPARTPSRVTAMPDMSVDVIICPLFLCQVPDVRAALSEMLRALKPQGKLFFIEHTQAGKLTPTNRAQKRMRLWWGMLFYGCKLDRKVYKDMEDVGFVNVEYEKFTADVDLGASSYIGDRLNRFLNWSFVYLIGPHVMGVATRPSI